MWLPHKIESFRCKLPANRVTAKIRIFLAFIEPGILNLAMKYMKIQSNSGIDPGL